MNTKLHREILLRMQQQLRSIDIFSEEFVKNAEQLSTAKTDKDKLFHERNCDNYAALKLKAHVEYINLAKQLRNDLMPEMAEPQNMVQMAEWFNGLNAMTC